MIGVGIGLGIGEFRGRAPGIAPKLDLNFASTKSLTASKGPTPSFSRASTGTYFNSSGVLTSAAINAPRFDHTFNGTSWVSRGLLVEEQRTNLHTYSENLSLHYTNLDNSTISLNGANSPDGSQTADKVVENSASSSQHAVSSSLSGLSGDFTYSIFLKEAGRYKVALLIQSPVKYACFDIRNGTLFDLSGLTATITNVGNGWFRATISFTGTTNYFQTNIILLPDSATSLGQRFYNGDGSSGVFAWGGQIESSASFATSYIPNLTTGSTTRSADVCQITGGDFSGFYNASEGSIAVDFDRLYVPSSGSALFSIRDAGNNNAIYSYISGSQDQSEIYTSGVVATFNFGTPSSINILSKISTAYKVNDFAGSRNGSTALTDSSGAVPVSPTYMVIGDTSGSSYLNGHIARLRYYNKRLPNATLQKLST